MVCVKLFPTKRTEYVFSVERGVFSFLVPDALLLAPDDSGQVVQPCPGTVQVFAQALHGIQVVFSQESNGVQHRLHIFDRAGNLRPVRPCFPVSFPQVKVAAEDIDQTVITGILNDLLTGDGIADAAEPFGEGSNGTLQGCNDCIDTQDLPVWEARGVGYD